jgi:hypothetical protein
VLSKANFFSDPHLVWEVKIASPLNVYRVGILLLLYLNLPNVYLKIEKSRRIHAREMSLFYGDCCFLKQY